MENINFNLWFSKGTYTITTSSQSVLHMILGTKKIFYNLLQELQLEFRLKLDISKISLMVI